MLDELRKKPRILRENYAFWGAFIFTGLVATIWLVSIPLRFSSVDEMGETEIKAESVGAMSNFFGQIKENFSAAWGQEKEDVSALNAEETATGTSKQEETTDVYPMATSSEPSRSPVRIATSSSRSVLVATSSEQNQ